LRNQLQYRYYVRALFADFDDWITGGVAPPPSQVPSVKDGTFVTLAQAAQLWPQIPGVPFVSVMGGLRLTDYGKMPPDDSGPAYPLFVTRTNADGSPAAGIVPPEIAVPVGTYSGRNFRAKGYAQGDLCGQSGMFVPFAATQAQRTAAGDSRLSVAERYTGEADFDAKRKQAADLLVQQRLLLPEDAATIEAGTLPAPAR
jgi:hypothetical protein